ncbi:hypothetical protein FRC03_012929 [Tulasnella sp. 419]|nr:hypothetical protein FRC02_000260 [Tulasnella sp. 418]KAG8965802.1 hypothetical protein FRC03_012929 [Tulasnella sp. 419]
MANASAKRTAADNEKALKNLRYGMMISSAIYVLLRFVLPFRPVQGLTQPIIYVLTLIPTLVLYRHLHSIGTPRRDQSTGALISAGEDLSQAGLTESCWDVIYVTWFCQVGSTLLGDWFWWFYLAIPAYAVWKLYTSVLGPLFFNKSGDADAPNDASNEQADGQSKRQQKLQKRSEKTGTKTKVLRR